MVAIGAAIGLRAQEINKSVTAFNKVVVSPKINLILEQGEHENVRVVYANIAPEKINIDVSGKTLRLYLEDARVTERTHKGYYTSREGIYKDATVTAYVTYKALRALEIRGDQELTCTSDITAKKFTLKAYGENEIKLTSLNTQYFKTSLYGVNNLKIKGGQAEYQKYRLFGENKIDTRALKSLMAKTNIYGESKIRLTTIDELKINSFGESMVYYNGDAQVYKGLIFGRTRIEKLN